MTCAPCVFGGERLPDRRACAELGCPVLPLLLAEDLPAAEAAARFWRGVSELDRAPEPSLGELAPW